MPLFLEASGAVAEEIVDRFLTQFWRERDQVVVHTVDVTVLKIGDVVERSPMKRRTKAGSRRTLVTDEDDQLLDGLRHVLLCSGCNFQLCLRCNRSAPRMLPKKDSYTSEHHHRDFVRATEYLHTLWRDNMSVHAVFICHIRERLPFAFWELVYVRALNLSFSYQET